MPRCAAIAAVVLLFVSVSSSPTVAADKCLSRQEARKMFPRVHLYWSIDGGQRCWSNRRGRHRTATPDGARAARPRPPPAAAAVPDSPAAVVRRDTPPRLGVAGEVAVAALMPPLEVPPPWLARWAWVLNDRAQADGVVFSTFEHETPDVWPVLREPQRATAGGLAVVVMCALLAMVFGLMLARWHMRRFGW